MKNIFIALLLMAGFAAELSAQDENTSATDTVPPIELQRQMYIYTLANKYNDAELAKNALYNILSITPGNTTVMDSLAVLYFDYQEYISAALISQDILRINPNDMIAARVGAISFETLGVPDKAIPLYEKLYLKENDISILYQIAFLQFTTKRFEESIVNIETIIGDKQAAERPLLFPLKDGRQQQVSLLSATYRMKGLLEAERGNTDQAREAYNKALEIVPDFESVKDLLAELE